jgi:hypothetical protein
MVDIMKIILRSPRLSMLTLSISRPGGDEILKENIDMVKQAVINSPATQKAEYTKR